MNQRNNKQGQNNDHIQYCKKIPIPIPRLNRIVIIFSRLKPLLMAWLIIIPKASDENIAKMDMVKIIGII